jgi:regulatory protein
MIESERGETRYITKIELQKKKRSRYNLYLDEEFALSIHEDILIKLRLGKGQAVDTEFLAKIMLEESYHSAYAAALRYVGRGPKSAKEVSNRLRREQCDLSVIQQIIQQLTEQGYLNDEQFAVQWTEHRIVAQKKGRLFVRQELQHKGVPKQHIEQAISEIDEETEYQSAYQLAVKRWNNSSDEDPVKYRKISAFLLRRGFPQAVVRKAMQQLGTPEFDESDLESFN